MKSVGEILKDRFLSQITVGEILTLSLISYAEKNPLFKKIIKESIRKLPESGIYKIRIYGASNKKVIRKIPTPADLTSALKMMEWTFEKIKDYSLPGAIRARLLLKSWAKTS